MLLDQGGTWYAGCGWRWGSSSTATLRMMEAFERRELVDRKVTLQRIAWKVRDPEAAWREVAHAQAKTAATARRGRKAAGLKRHG